MTLRPNDHNSTSKNATDTLVQTTLIPAIDKANILMVLCGNKPSMHTGFFSDFIPIGQAVPASHITNKNIFSKILSNLGLSYRIQIKSVEREQDGIQSFAEWTVFCVAREMSTAEELLEARECQDEMREGILLGFPKSAVKAYVNNTMIAADKVPASTEYVSTDEMKFLNHRLSKDNWQEEIKYLPDFARLVKHISQEIYEQCLAAWD